MTGGAGSIRHVLHGPPRHGVTRYGRRLFAALQDDPQVTGDNKNSDAAHGATTGLVHVTFTDHLFGSTPDDAVRAVLELAEGSPLSVSLHDVPQEQEGAGRFERRRRAYVRLIQRAAVVVVNSEHEAKALRAWAPTRAAAVHVVPLPLEVSGGDPQLVREPSGDGVTVGLMGFVYPGKGYERVVEAAAPGSSVVMIGQVADGHVQYVRGLRAQARQRGVSVQVTGYVPEEHLAEHLHGVDVAVCPHLHVSASGSLNTWIAHGRRPLVLSGGYMVEVAQRWPDLVHLVEADNLAQAMRAAAQDPESTWITGDLPQWGWPQVAREYQRIWATVPA